MSASEMVSTITLGLAMILISPAREFIAPKINNPAAPKSTLRLFIVWSPLRPLPRLEINSGLYNQSVSVVRETMRVLLRIKAIGVGVDPIAIHEMSLELHVPEFLQVNPRANDFVVNVVPRQTAVAFVRYYGVQGSPTLTGSRV